MWRIGDEGKLLSVSRSFLSSAGAGSSSTHGPAAATVGSNLTHLDVRRIPGVEALADQGNLFPSLLHLLLIPPQNQPTPFPLALHFLFHSPPRFPQSPRRLEAGQEAPIPLRRPTTARRERRAL